MGCKYDFSFARTSILASRSKKTSSTAISVQGSKAFGGGNGSVNSSINSYVGKGGIVLYPFLDLNQNGIFDKEEHLVRIAAVKVNGARAIINKKDSLVRIPNLSAFTNYFLEFDNNTLENIAWSFTHKTYQVLVDPNQFKRIDIPIASMGEVSGIVSINKENALKGIGRILIKIYQKDSTKIVAETFSEPDGYIYKLGLKPGEYKACVDGEQLINLNFIADPPLRYFTIKTSEEGDVVDGLDFILRKK